MRPHGGGCRLPIHVESGSRRKPRRLSPVVRDKMQRDGGQIQSVATESLSAAIAGCFLPARCADGDVAWGFSRPCATLCRCNGSASPPALCSRRAADRSEELRECGSNLSANPAHHTEFF